MHCICLKLRGESHISGRVVLRGMVIMISQLHVLLIADLEIIKIERRGPSEPEES